MSNNDDKAVGICSQATPEKKGAASDVKVSKAAPHWGQISMLLNESAQTRPAEHHRW